MTEGRNVAKGKIGRVVSDKMQKTVVVEVEHLRRHPLYRRMLRESRRFKVHDETSAAKIGDIVRIVETRPLSREKRWRLAEIIKSGGQIE
ncbi:MAG: 30S ribosomal protein S17 [Chloroflexi bacterium]|nr:30S ribosomal protein S17 [Chloroflexota bacterium]